MNLVSVATHKLDLDLWQDLEYEIPVQVKEHDKCEGGLMSIRNREICCLLREEVNVTLWSSFIMKKHGKCNVRRGKDNAIVALVSKG